MILKISKLLTIIPLMIFNADCMQQNICKSTSYAIFQFHNNVNAIHNNSQIINSYLNTMKNDLQCIIGYIDNYKVNNNKMPRTAWRNVLLQNIKNLRNEVQNIQKKSDKIYQSYNELQNLENNVNQLIPVFYDCLYKNIDRILSSNNEDEISDINVIVQDDEVKNYITRDRIRESIHKDEKQIQKEFYDDYKKNYNQNRLNRNTIIDKYITKINATLKKYYDEIKQFQNKINRININRILDNDTKYQVNIIHTTLNKYLDERKKYIDKTREQLVNYIIGICS